MFFKMFSLGGPVMTTDFFLVTYGEQYLERFLHYCI